MKSPASAGDFFFECEPTGTSCEINTILKRSTVVHSYPTRLFIS